MNCYIDSVVYVYVCVHVCTYELLYMFVWLGHIFVNEYENGHVHWCMPLLSINKWEIVTNIFLLRPILHVASFLQNKIYDQTIEWVSIGLTAYQHSSDYIALKSELNAVSHFKAFIMILLKLRA